jgi:hypothetical protein
MLLHFAEFQQVLGEGLIRSTLLSGATHFELARLDPA